LGENIQTVNIIVKILLKVIALEHANCIADIVNNLIKKKRFELQAKELTCKSIR